MRLFLSYFYLLLIIITCLIHVSCEKDTDIIDPDTLGKWKYYNTSNGLTDNCIYTIKQDKEGNIWIGTYNAGVCMYDGSRWSYYNTSSGLLSNRVYTIEQDGDGYMWFGTPLGFNFLVEGYLFYVDSLYGMPVSVTALFCDSKDQMWVGTEGQGIFMFDERGLNYAFLDDPKHWFVNQIMEDSDGIIWLATPGGALSFNGSTFTVFDESVGLSNNDINYIFQDSWGDIWFASFYGEYLSRFDGSEFEQVKIYNTYTTTAVWSMVEDFNRNIWFVTGGAGIVRYDGTEMHIINTNNGLRDNVVICSAIDHDGNLWFGTREGGINIYITE